MTSPAQPDRSSTVAGQPAPTGHPELDAALARLADAGELPPEQQVSVYEAVHQALRQTLASIDG